MSMTSPASVEPITVADRERAKELWQSDQSTPGMTWHALAAAFREYAPTFEARVVELEASLAAAEARCDETFTELSDEQEAHEQTAKDLETSEARATALLEVLRPFAAAAGAYDVLSLPHSDDLYLNGLLSAFPGISEARIQVGDLRAARAAINAGASNDRK